MDYINMDAYNFTKQAEEIEALSAIYGDDWKVESKATKCYSISISIEKENSEVTLYVTMPEAYPSLAPPKYELSAPWMHRKAKAKLHSALDEVYLDYVGESVVFQWVERIRELLYSMNPSNSKKKNRKSSAVVSLSPARLEVKCPEITHGDVIVDRKSSFQGHAAEVHSLEDVSLVLAELKKIRKILNAKHNVYAYRLEEKSAKGQRLISNSDNDGEAHAGEGVLHLMETLDQRNTLVVVSRWFGGIQLGPDRFRHYNNSAKKVLLQSGLLKK